MSERPGRIVVLNGPSSSGKTTIARATREVVGARCCAVSIDQLYDYTHPAAKNDWGLFLALTEALFSLVASFARNDFSVVVDTVFERRDCLEVCRQTLADFEVSLVGLYCPGAVLQAREQRREDRPEGLGLGQLFRVHEHCSYDLTLDTAEHTVQECASRIAALLQPAPG